MKVTVCDLTKKYGTKTAVDHLDLELTPGIWGLLGPNGAGKTTLMRLLCDLLRPDSGAVLLDGENIRSMGEDYREILGYLPQKVGYYPWFTGEKYLRYLAVLKGLPSAEIPERVEALLRQAGLYEERKKRLGAYSGGMLQRIGIAQALLNDPRILILDEPTAGLDPQERIRFRTMIAGLAQDRLVLLSTHIVSDVEHLAQQVILLREGSLAAVDSVEAVCRRMAGQVCTMTVSADEAERLRRSCQVVNMQPADRGILLRLICPQGLPAGAVPAEPCLEDAYLALCGKEAT